MCCAPVFPAVQAPDSKQFTATPAAAGLACSSSSSIKLHGFQCAIVAENSTNRWLMPPINAHKTEQQHLNGPAAVTYESSSHNLLAKRCPRLHDKCIDKPKLTMLVPVNV
jgi:hypothetical protein